MFLELIEGKKLVMVEGLESVEEEVTLVTLKSKITGLKDLKDTPCKYYDPGTDKEIPAKITFKKSNKVTTGSFLRIVYVVYGETFVKIVEVSVSQRVFLGEC